MKHHLIYYVVWVFLFCSCNKSHKKKIINEFKEEKNIENEAIKLKNDSIFSMVFGMICLNDNLIAYDVDNIFLFSITDLKKHEMLSKFGKLGQGPEDISSLPTSVSIVDQTSISFFESNKNILYTINLKDPVSPTIQKNEFLKESEEMFMSLSPIKSNLFIATGTFANGRYLLMNKNGEKISYNFDYPHVPNKENLTNAHKAMAFQGKLMARPDGERFFFACEDSEIFEIIKIEQDNKLNKIYEFHGELAHFKAEGDGITTIASAIDRNSNTKFVDAYGTQNFIYLLYANKIIGNDIYKSYLANTILVFDWNGKAIKKLNLDTDLSKIAVDEFDKTLYGIDPNSETYLVKFPL
ncbi:BF3164 family lipoprotein [Proteiniphilum sp. X52]|uniref:BF3164 family lipoprotein n=1 Tax=Proteiniphilum sp. X52 TaxID=2382159 RepID=UPI000F09F242|nr:BF3164 family lipoprotein [Proteiniphilum sp. X52]RNC63315.1 hypothetical protein D7D25_17185 [Proteiniphilum sp. X52]